MSRDAPLSEPSRLPGFGEHLTIRSRAQRFGRPIEYDDHGRETRIGVVVPFDFSLDWEYWMYLPPEVALHFTRTPHLRRDAGMYLARAAGKPSVVARTARTLLAVDPAATLYACTSGSYVHGVDGEAAIRTAMAEVGCRNPVTSSGAAVRALTAAGARRVSIVTPYSRHLTHRLIDYLSEAGFEVVSAHYLGLHRGIAGVSQRTIKELVREADGHGADAVFVSCTSLRTYGTVADLESELGIPVFTSNQVSLWAVLVAAGVLPRPHEDDWILGGGRPAARSTMLLLDAAAGEVAA